MRFCDYRHDFLKSQSDLSFHYMMPVFRDLHTHNYFECFFITQGEVIHHINGEKFRLKKGSINVIRPDDCHEFIPVSNEKPMLINVMITPERLKTCLDTIDVELFELLRAHKSHLSLELNESQQQFFLELLNKYLINGKARSQGNIIMLYIYEVIKIFYLTYYNELNSETSVQYVYPDWLKDLLEKFSEPKNFELTLDELLEDIHFSRVHINRLFKLYMHEPLAHYYNKVKLNYACNLLTSTNLLVLEISTRIGYSSLSHFQNVFKTTYGMTPRQYRLNHTKLPPPQDI
jgi:AraC family cel operon transcriptional repressor